MYNHEKAFPFHKAVKRLVLDHCGEALVLYLKKDVDQWKGIRREPSKIT